MSLLEDKAFVENTINQMWLNCNKPQPKPYKERKRKYHLKPNFFDKISTECEAYFLGLLLTDGCNTRNRIMISLQERDKHILKQLAKAVYVENKPLEFVNTKKYYPKAQNQYRLSIHNKQLAQHVKSFGLIPRKSLILEYPRNDVISKKLFPHFLRGLFDGDGCITGPFFKNVNELSISFSICSASKTFLDSLQTKIQEYLNISSLVYLHKKAYPTKGKKGHAAMYNLLIEGGGRQIENLYLALYENAHFYLHRKRNRFDSFMQMRYYYILPKLE